MDTVDTIFDVTYPSQMILKNQKKKMMALIS